MLSQEENQNSLKIIRNAINSITSGKSNKHSNQELSVSAKVEEKNIIIEEKIQCIFNINHDSAEIHIFWEEYGYKGYKDMGLYGQMNSKWQKIIMINETSFTISDDTNSYLVTINY